MTTADLYFATVQQSYGGNGGAPFVDPDSAITRGPLTRIDVRHGSRIDGLRLYYGSDGIGTWHGGNGGALSTYLIPEGHRIIRVEGRAGSRIDQLQFFTDQGNASPVFGGNGGRPFSVSDPTGGALRTLSGRSGSELDQLVVQFGAPYYITAITFDPQALDTAKIEAVPVELWKETLVNKTSLPQTVTYARSVTLTTQKSYNFEEGQSLTLSAEMTAGVPAVASMKAAVSATTTFKAGQTLTDINSQTESWSVPVTVPPQATIQAVTVARRYTLNLPFSYTVVWYQGGRDNVVKRVTLSGQYTGVNVADLDHTFTQNP